MNRVLPTGWAVFLFAQTIGGLRFIFVGGVIAVFAILAGQN
jgi:hypothetical protein